MFYNDPLGDQINQQSIWALNYMEHENHLAVIQRRNFLPQQKNFVFVITWIERLLQTFSKIGCEIKWNANQSETNSTAKGSKKA